MTKYAAAHKQLYFSKLYCHALETMLYEYILDLISESRKIKKGGLSTRAALGIIGAAKACAFFKGEDAVLPDHVKFIFNAVTEHRLDDGFKKDIPLSDLILKEVDAIR